MKRKKIYGGYEATITKTLSFLVTIPVGVWKKKAAAEFKEELERNASLRKIYQKKKGGEESIGKLNSHHWAEFIVDKDREIVFYWFGKCNRCYGGEIIETKEMLSIIILMPFWAYRRSALPFLKKFGRHAVRRRGTDQGECDDRIHEIEFIINHDQESKFKKFIRPFLKK